MSIRIYIELDEEELLNTLLLNNTLSQFINTVDLLAQYFGEDEEYDEEYEIALRESEDMLKKKDIVLNIKSAKYNENKDNEECTICKEEFKKEEYVSILKCSHIFHEECIREWGKMKPECAICRDIIEHSENKS